MSAWDVDWVLLTMVIGVIVLIAIVRCRLDLRCGLGHTSGWRDGTGAAYCVIVLGSWAGPGPANRTGRRASVHGALLARARDGAGQTPPLPVWLYLRPGWGSVS
jgi:hypothetical protein